MKKKIYDNETNLKSKNSSSSIIDHLNLNELDKQLINCISNSKSPISYEQLYNIATSIIAIDFDQIQNYSKENSEDREEFEKTLTKILQLCQTVIDFLLTDIKHLKVECTELTDRNNFVQENLKLRKLLQLQQKALIYRRMNMTFGPLQSSCSSNNNVNEDEDNSLDNLDQLSSDSKSNNHNGSLTFTTTKFQCFYCSKTFTDANAFTKHLQLRHLTSNLDDPSLSLSSSLSSNLTLFQRLFQQQCQQNNLVDSSSEGEIHHLQDEIQSLKDKLTKTTIQLEEEKLARKNFEKDLKIDFKEQVKLILVQLENKIEEIRLQKSRINEEKSKRDKNKNEQDHQLISKIKFKKGSKILKRELDISPKQDEIQKEIESETNSFVVNWKQSYEESKIKNFKDNEKKSSKISDQMEAFRKHLDSFQQESENNDQQLKQSLRNELISHLTTKREQRQREVKMRFDSIELVESDKQNKPILEKILSIDEQQNQSNESTIYEQSEKNQTKAEIYQSIEARIKSYLGEQTDRNNLNENVFHQAMDRIHQEKNLLIQQSRHDYDFTRIENSIRNIIDSKVQNKINQQIGQEIEQFDNLTISKNIKNEPELELNNDKINHDLLILKNEMTKEDTNQSEKKSLKSILKDRTNDQRRESKKNITFNNEVVEFEISPLSSDNDADNGDDNENGTGFKIPKPSNSNNRIFVFDNELNIHEQNLSFDGQKIFLNNNLDQSSPTSSSTTSSTTSSDNEEDNELNDRIEGKPSSESNHQVVTVDIHYSEDFNKQKNLPVLPIPAKRRNVPTSELSSLDSLLNNESNLKKNSDPQDLSASLHVHELAELIEKKLQNPNRSSLTETNQQDSKKLPPLGSIDNKMMMNMKKSLNQLVTTERF